MYKSSDIYRYAKVPLILAYYFRLMIFNNNKTPKKKPKTKNPALFLLLRAPCLHNLSCCNLAISYVYVENHIKYKETQAYFFQFVSDLSVDSVYINNKNMLQQWKGLGNRLVYNFYSLPLMAIAHHKLEVFLRNQIGVFGYEMINKQTLSPLTLSLELRCKKQNGNHQQGNF